MNNPLRQYPSSFSHLPFLPSSSTLFASPSSPLCFIQLSTFPSPENPIESRQFDILSCPFPSLFISFRPSSPFASPLFHIGPSVRLSQHTLHHPFIHALHFIHPSFAISHPLVMSPSDNLLPCHFMSSMVPSSSSSSSSFTPCMYLSSLSLTHLSAPFLSSSTRLCDPKTFLLIAQFPCEN